MLKLIGGSEDTSQIIMRHAGSQGALDYRVTLNYDENEGYAELHDSSTTSWLGFRGDYQIDSNDRLLFETGYSSGMREEGSPATAIPPIRDTKHTYHFQQLRWNHTIATENELSLQFYHNYQNIEDDTSFTHPLAPGSILTYGLGFETNRYDLELEHTFRPRDDLRLVWGLGARHDRMRSWDLLNRKDNISRNQLRAFFNAEWHIRDDIALKLGAMYEDFDGYDGLLSPRLALNYHLTNNHTIRTSASRAYRMPTIWEANADLQIHGIPAPFGEHLHFAAPGTEPERIDAFEIGYLGIFPESNITLDIRLFREKLDPLISSRNDNSIFVLDINDPGAIHLFNSGYLHIDGIEFQLDFRPTKRTILHLGYSITTAKGEEVRETLPTGLPDPDPMILDDVVANHTFSILASHRFHNGLQLSGSIYYIDDVEWKDDGSLIPAYHRLDLRLSKKIKLPAAAAEISLVLQNINGDHVEFVADDESMTEPQAYLQIGMEF